MNHNIAVALLLHSRFAGLILICKFQQDRIHAVEHKLLVRGVNIVLKKRLATQPAPPNTSASR